MTSSTTFLGIPFTVNSVAPNANVNVIRVVFSAQPKQSNPYATNDALNAALYTIAGPSVKTIVGVTSVSGQPEAIDLILDSQLTVGIWDVSVSASIVSSSLAALTGTLSFQFSVSSVPTLQTRLAPGCEDTNAEGLLRSFLPEVFTGKAWDALIAAVATGDTYVFDTARKAFFQQYTATAEGKYLDFRGADKGILRPLGLGMTDDLYRQYITALTSNQVTMLAAWELMEVFWGRTAVSGYVTSANYEPFALNDGDTLSLMVDRKTPLTIVFLADDFAAISAATALEACAAINKAAKSFRVPVTATPWTDPETGYVHVRIFSDAIGNDSVMAVTSGLAQNALQFPTVVSGIATVPITWTITSSGRTVRFSTTSSNATLANVRVGDYVNLVPFSAAGSYIVTDVRVSTFAGLTQFFEFESTESFGASFTQTVASEISFYRPDTFDIFHGIQRTVNITEDNGVLRVVVPATSEIIARTPSTGGAYVKANAPQDNSSANTTWSRTTKKSDSIRIQTASAHTITNGRAVIEDELVSSIVPPADPSSAGDLGKPNVRRWSQMGDYTGVATSRWKTSLIPFGENKCIMAGGLSDDSPRTLTTDCVAIEFSDTNYSYTLEAGLDSNVEGGASGYIPAGHPLAWTPVIAGGEDALSVADDVQAMDPTTKTWRNVCYLAEPRRDCKMVWIPSLQAFLIGPGYSVGAETTCCDLCFPTNAPSFSWILAGMSNYPRNAVTQYGLAALLGDTDERAALICGGYTTGVGAIAQCDLLYKGATIRWSTGTLPGDTTPGDMAYARYGHGCVEVPWGNKRGVFVVGGMGRKASSSASDAPLRSTEIYDSAKGAWRLGPSTRIAHATNVQLNWVSDTEILVVSAEGAEILNTQTMRWGLVFDAASQIKFGTTNFDFSSCGPYWLAMNYFPIPAGNNTYGLALNEGASRIGVIGSADIHPVTVTSATDYRIAQYNNDFFVGGSNKGEITKMSSTAAATTDAKVYAVDPKTGASMTDVSSTLSTAISGTSCGTITVADATSFPQAGFIVIGLGYDYQTQPIEYYAKSGNSLSIDSSYVFQSIVPAGADVTVLNSKAPYAPTVNFTGAFHITPSSLGRIVALDSLEQIMAADSNLTVEVEYPGTYGLGDGDETYIWGE